MREKEFLRCKFQRQIMSGTRDITGGEVVLKNSNKDSDVFIVEFEQISHIVLVFPLMTLNK